MLSNQQYLMILDSHNHSVAIGATNNQKFIFDANFLEGHTYTYLYRDLCFFIDQLFRSFWVKGGGIIAVNIKIYISPTQIIDCDFNTKRQQVLDQLKIQSQDTRLLNINQLDDFNHLNRYYKDRSGLF